METAVGPPARERALWATGFGLLVAAVAVYYGAFTLRRPYHLDTILYLDGIRSLLEDHALVTAFPSRIGNTWLYLPGVALLGEAGLLWTNVAVIVATTALYARAIDRDFGRIEAWAAAVTFASAPAILVTVAHLKEDCNALLFVAAALAIVRRGAGPARAAVAGALTGFAVLTKEFAVLLVPFVAAHVFLARAEPDSWRRWVRLESARRTVPVVLAFAGAALAMILAFSPHHFRTIHALMGSRHTGQLVGLEALARSWQWRWAAWSEGALHLAFLPALAPLACIVAIRRREVRTLLWVSFAAVAFALLASTTVTVSRIFGPVLFLVLPATWRGVRLALEAVSRAAWREGSARHLSGAVTLLLAGGVGAWHVAELTPTLAYRNAFPPQATYFEGLRRSAPADAVLYGMDNCSLATYYTGLACRTHPVDASPGEARAFVDGLVTEAARRPVLLLHDFAAYDPGTIAAELDVRTRSAVAYAALGEDYHAVSWVPSWDGAVASIERATGCRGEGVSLTPFPGAAPGLERAMILLGCRERAAAVQRYGYRGHPTTLEELRVVRVFPR